MRTSFVFALAVCILSVTCTPAKGADIKALTDAEMQEIIDQVLKEQAEKKEKERPFYNKIKELNKEKLACFKEKIDQYDDLTSPASDIAKIVLQDCFIWVRESHELWAVGSDCFGLTPQQQAIDDKCSKRVIIHDTPDEKDMTDALRIVLRERVRKSRRSGSIH